MKSLKECLNISINESIKKIKQLSFEEFMEYLRDFDSNAQDQGFEPILDGDDFDSLQKILAKGVKTPKDLYEYFKKNEGNSAENMLWDLFNDYLPGE